MKEFETVVIDTYADISPRWEGKKDLSGRRYTFEVSYNTRQEAWVMKMSDVNGNVLIAGINLVYGVNFLEKYRASSPGLPPGEIYLFDYENNIQTAVVTRNNLGSRFKLKYSVAKEV